MKKFFLIAFITIFLMSIFFIKVKITSSGELEEITKDLENLKKELSLKEINYQQLNNQLENIRLKIKGLESEIIKKEQEVKKGEKALVYQKTLLNEKARSYYRNTNKNSLLLIGLFVGENFSNSLKSFFYQQNLMNQDKETIIKIVLYIKKIGELKKNLEEEKNQLFVLKQEVDNQAEILNQQIVQTKTKIAQLSARQQQLIAEKQASLGISRSASSLGRCDSDLTNGRDPGFSPKFGFFTFGVPNRVGMNQYGAYGRANAGQNHETILRAYYNFDSLEKTDINIIINVEGYGSYSLEDYVKRIYEVPSSWPIEVLKAQAIAARSYAFAYTNKGERSICATERCQVFKPDPKRGAWEQAVNETAGVVMVQSGNPIKAWYSSTHGGYVFSSADIGWSATSWTKRVNDFEGGISSFSELQQKAYDRDSPWFYCNWGSRPEYNKTAWMRQEEVADIVNVILLVKNDLSTRDNLYQTDKPNPLGKESWSYERVKIELKNRGIRPYNYVSEISVSADFNQGKSISVNILGDGGSVSFSASEFKDWFNLRAPANIQIVGPLYNVEKR